MSPKRDRTSIMADRTQHPRPSSLGLAAGLGQALLLAGCVTLDDGTALAPAREIAATEPGKEIVEITGDDAEARAKARARSVLRRELTVDAAVEVALLRNKMLQAAFAELGIAQAEAFSASLPPAPTIALSSLAGSGNLEIERHLAVSLLALATFPARAAIAEESFRAAQLRAALSVLRLAAEVRRHYFMAVAANQKVGFLEEAVAGAKAAAELAKALGEAGNLNKLDQAREDAFYAELGAELADARIQRMAARERLVRLLGLWGEDIDIRLPRRLPALPRRVVDEPMVEALALEKRVDLAAARHDLKALARDLGLTRATRFVSDLDLALQDDKEWGPSQNDFSAERLVRRGVAGAFTIPIYDLGEAGVRRAEKTYMSAANRLAQTAIGVRSEAREAYLRMRGKHDLARQYEERVLPLRQAIVKETQLLTSGMLVDVSQLIIDARARVLSNIAAIEARRDYFIATGDLLAATVGGARPGD